MIAFLMLVSATTTASAYPRATETLISTRIMLGGETLLWVSYDPVECLWLKYGQERHSFARLNASRPTPTLQDGSLSNAMAEMVRDRHFRGLHLQFYGGIGIWEVPQRRFRGVPLISASGPLANQIYPYCSFPPLIDHLKRTLPQTPRALRRAWTSVLIDAVSEQGGFREDTDSLSILRAARRCYRRGDCVLFTTQVADGFLDARRGTVYRAAECSEGYAELVGVVREDERWAGELWQVENCTTTPTLMWMSTDGAFMLGSEPISEAPIPADTCPRLLQVLDAGIGGSSHTWAPFGEGELEQRTQDLPDGKRTCVRWRTPSGVSEYACRRLGLDGEILHTYPGLCGVLEARDGLEQR